MPFQQPFQTPTIRTGNVRTSVDPFTPGQTAAGTGVVPNYFYGGLYNTLGTMFMDQGGSDSVSGTLTQLPLYAPVLYKYVLYKSTTNPAMLAAPGVVYYTDNTETVVSGAMADGLSTTANSLAGYLMVNTTDLTTITATILNNGGNGSGVWIAVGGFVKAATAITSTAVGDTLVGAGTTGFTPARVAAGTAPTFTKTITALTALSGAVADVIVNIVPVC